MATSPNAMMGQVAPGAPSNLSPSVIAQLQQDMMGMPLDQLQQYAQQHMDDPVYGPTVVSMATYVANMKKSAQVPQVNATQPTVAQQAVQGIAPAQQAAPPMPQGAPAANLPENQGIGQLPARNIESMAGGGIVGYAGGGHIPSYAGSTDGSFVMPKSQSVLGDVPIYTDTPLLPQQGAPENNQVPLLRRLGTSFYENIMQPHPIDPRTLAPTPSVVPNTATNLAPAGPNPTDARLAAGTQTPPGGPAAAPALSLSQPPAAAPAAPVGPGATGNITSGNSAMSQGLGSFVSPTGKMIADAKKALGDDANMTLKDHVAQAQGMLPQVYSSDDADLEIQAQKFRDAVGGDPAFKKDLDRLDKLDSKLEKNKQDSVGINTLLAGLSMIRSGNPWEAIAQGAGTGLKSYKDDMDKIDKAQEEHEKMRQNLDVAAMANNMGFTRMAADSVKEAKSAQVRSAEAALSAGSHAFDAEQQRMTTLAGENIRGQYGLQQATIGANAPSATMKDLKYFMDNPAALEMQKNMPAFQQAARQEIQTNLSNSLKIAQDMSGQFTPEQKNQAAINVFAYQKQLDEMAKNATPKPVPTANDYAYVKANPSAREKFVRTFGIEP